MLAAHPMDYVRALRLKMGVFAFALVLSGLSHIVGRTNSAGVFAAVVACILTCAVVIWNDYYDREHDKKKNRTLASLAPGVFLSYTFVLWGLSLVGILLVHQDNPRAAMVLAGMGILGWVYSWCRKLPLLSGMVVAICYGSLSLVAAAFADMVSPVIVAFHFGAIALFVFGRETISDLADLDIDHGYKFTLPVLLGPWWARRVILCCLSVAMTCACMLTGWMLLFLPAMFRLFPEILKEDLDFERIYRLVDVQTIGFIALLFVV